MCHFMKIQLYDPIGCLWPLEVYQGITYTISTKGKYMVIKNTYGDHYQPVFDTLDHLKRWAVEEYFADHI